MSTLVNNTILLENARSADNIPSKDFHLALRDLRLGLMNYKFWSFMGFLEIRRRYRRTVIGPLWTTLSLGIFISCLGIMLSILWHSNPKEFLPYFCAGYITWTLIQTIIVEGCVSFISAAGCMRQVTLPFTTYACIIAWRNIIIFAHHLAILFLVLWYAGVSININFLLILPALGLIFFTGTWVSILLGMICARYRDLQQAIVSFLQLAMYVTPIMWRPEQLGTRTQIITTINPLNHFTEIIRLPLIGEIPSLFSWNFAIIFSLLGFGITLLFLTKNYRKLVFWL